MQLGHINRIVQLEKTVKDQVQAHQTTSGLTQNQNISLKVLSRCLSNTDTHSTSTTTPGGLFQCLFTLSVNKLSLTSSLNFPNAAESHSHLSCHQVPEKKDKHLSQLPLLRKVWKAIRSPLNLLFFRLEEPSVLSHPSQDMPSSLQSFIVHVHLPEQDHQDKSTHSPAYPLTKRQFPQSVC